MKKLISVLLALVMALSLCATAWADDPVLTGFCGADSTSEKAETITGNTWVYGTQTPFSTDIYKNVSWKLEKNGETDTYTMTISGSGAMADYLAGSVRPWNSYVGKITKLVIENGVTTVGSRTCYNSTALTEVVLPASVTEIGEFSFSGCKALSTIDLSSVTNIRASALRGDSALANVALSNALTAIGDQAFRDSGAAGAVLSLPASVTTIGYNAFANAKFTNAIDLPNVTKVGACAFSGAKFAAVVLTNSALTITPGKEESNGNEETNGVFANTAAVFYTSVPAVMDNLFDANRMNNTGIIACTNGGSFEAGTKFGGFTLSVPVKDGFIFDGWYSDADFSDNSKLAADNNGKYIGEPTTSISRDGRRYYAKWEPTPVYSVDKHTLNFTSSGAQTVTVSYNGTNGSISKVDFDDGSSFAATINGLTVTVAPKAGLSAGTYHDTMYIHTGDDAVFVVTVNATVEAASNPGNGGSTGNNSNATNPYIKDEPKAETPTKVESSKTFDPGVALYAGMALVSAAGMAWTARKRGE